MSAPARDRRGPRGRPKEALEAEETRANFRQPADWLIDALVGTATVAGERVNEQIAMGLSAWYAAIRAISEDTAKLDLILYRRRKDRGKDRASGHPLYRLLHDKPNSDQTSIVFRETLLQHALGWGNGYAEIIRIDGRGMATALWLLDPTTVTSKRNAEDKLFYRVMQPGGGFVDLAANDVLHIHGLGPMGDTGYNLTRIAREAIGTYIALQKFGGAFFGNGSTVGGILQHPGELGDKALRHLREQFSERHSTAGNAYKMLIAEEGITYKQLGIAPEQGQFIQSKFFAIEDVARWFRIPPHKLQHLLRATFSNIEAQSIEYLTDTILPWLKRIEQEINSKLLPADGTMFVEHLVESILRADIKTQNESYKIAIEGGWMSRNEARIKQNMNPEEGLDDFLVPMNMAVVGEEPPTPPTPPKPPTAPTDNGEGDGTPDDDSRAMCVRLAEVHRPMPVERFRSVLEQENRAMKRPKQSREDWLAGRGPYIRTALVPAVDTFCSSVWCVMNSGEMPEPALRAVADAITEMSTRHVDRITKHATPEAKCEPWAPNAAACMAWEDMDTLIATMTRICTEYGNDN